MAATEKITGRVQFPMFTAAALAAANPVLLKGEVVYESDTRRRKIGDGVTAWKSLPYESDGEMAGSIHASQITTDATHRFVTDSEKKTWGDKAAKDLSNVTLTKALSSNGYYKAPDGLMFQWGISPRRGVSVLFQSCIHRKAVRMLSDGLLRQRQRHHSRVVCGTDRPIFTLPIALGEPHRQERRSRILYRNRPLAGDRTLEIKYRKL